MSTARYYVVRSHQFCSLLIFYSYAILCQHIRRCIESIIMARSRLDISMSHHHETAHDHYLRSRTEQRMVDDEASRKKYALLGNDFTTEVPITPPQYGSVTDSSMAHSRLDISMSHHQETAHDPYLRSRTEQRMVDDEASRRSTRYSNYIIRNDAGNRTAIYG